MIQTVTQTRIIRDGTGTSSRIIITPVTSTRLIRDGGAQGATGANGAIGGMTFTTVTTNLTMAVKTAYKVTNTVRVLLAMPSGAVGDEIYVYNYGVGGFRIICHLSPQHYVVLSRVGWKLKPICCYRWVYYF